MPFTPTSATYVAVSYLGAGAYGKVYKCYIKHTNQYVALKSVPLAILRCMTSLRSEGDVKSPKLKDWDTILQLNECKYFSQYFLI